MVSIRFFAGYREKIKKDQLEVALESDVTLGEFIKMLSSRYPELEDIFHGKSVSIAVNHELASSDHVLKNDDEIAVFPPVSGG